MFVRNLVAVVTILLLSRLILAGVCLYHRHRRPHPESSRKLLHVGMGLLICTWPWVFDRPWPALVLCSAYVGALLCSSLIEPLHYRLGHVVYAVERPSRGEYYFPLIVAMLFTASRGEPLLFCVPVLLLTLADTAAALVGTHYGQHRFRVAGSAKSIEGSAAFFVTAFLIVHICLLLASPFPPATTLAIAAGIAAVATVLEALAWNGLDNLFVPLAGFLALRAAMVIAPY